MKYFVGVIGIYLLLCTFFYIFFWDNNEQKYSEMMEIKDTLWCRIFAFSLLYFRGPYRFLNASYRIIVLKERADSEEEAGHKSENDDPPIFPDY